jgi:aldehyde dehydrogenase (NAD+)
MEFNDLAEVILEVNQHPKPLALYYFTGRKDREEKVLGDISFGGGCINDTVMHLASIYLPFGGVGESGMGQYHGKSSFDTFTHYKSILNKSNLIDVPLRYPGHKHIGLVKRIMK